MKPYEEHVSTIVYPDGALVQSSDGSLIVEAMQEALALYELEAK